MMIWCHGANISSLKPNSRKSRSVVRRENWSSLNLSAICGKQAGGICLARTLERYVPFLNIGFSRMPTILNSSSGRDCKTSASTRESQTQRTPNREYTSLLQLQVLSRVPQMLSTVRLARKVLHQFHLIAPVPLLPLRIRLLRQSLPPQIPFRILRLQPIRPTPTRIRVVLLWASFPRIAIPTPWTRPYKTTSGLRPQLQIIVCWRKWAWNDQLRPWDWQESNRHGGNCLRRRSRSSFSTPNRTNINDSFTKPRHASPHRHSLTGKAHNAATLERTIATETCRMAKTWWPAAISIG